MGRSRRFATQQKNRGHRASAPSRRRALGNVARQQALRSQASRSGKQPRHSPARSCPATAGTQPGGAAPTLKPSHCASSATNESGKIGRWMSAKITTARSHGSESPPDRVRRHLPPRNPSCGRRQHTGPTPNPARPPRIVDRKPARSVASTSTHDPRKRTQIRQDTPMPAPPTAGLREATGTAQAKR